MIRNPIYKGIERYGHCSKAGDVVEREYNEALAIVSAEEWTWANERLEENVKWTNRNQKREYLLTGLIHCECGFRYYGKPSFNGRKWYIHYTCGRRMQSSQKIGQECLQCNSLSVPLETIEERVWKYTVACIKERQEVARRLLERRHAIDERLEDSRSERDDLNRQMEGLKSEEDRLFQIYRKGIINETKLESQLREVEQEREQLKERIALIDSRSSALTHWVQEVSRIEQALEAYEEKLERDLNFQERREIVRDIVREIFVRTEAIGGKRTAVIDVVSKFDMLPGVLAASETKGSYGFYGCEQSPLLDLYVLRTRLPFLG